MRYTNQCFTYWLLSVVAYQTRPRGFFTILELHSTSRTIWDVLEFTVTDYTEHNETLHQTVNVTVSTTQLIWLSEWVSSVLRPRQHSIGYMGDSFYRSKDPTNSIKVLKRMLQKRKKTTKTTKYTYTQTIMYTQKNIHKISTASPLVYTNMGWLGDTFHRGQGC